MPNALALRASFARGLAPPVTPLGGAGTVAHQRWARVLRCSRACSRQCVASSAPIQPTVPLTTRPPHLPHLPRLSPPSPSPLRALRTPSPVSSKMPAEQQGDAIGSLCACARVGGPQLGRETGAETIAQLEVLYGEGKRAGAESKLLAFPRWRYARQSSRFATPCTAHSSGTEHYGGRGHRRRRRLQPHVPFAGLRRAAAAVRRLADRGPGRAPHRSTSELELPTGRSVNAAVTGRR